MKAKLILALMAFIQVGLVACNVLFISHGQILAMLITAFGISMLWSFNIKKVTFGNISDRVAYAIGAALGTYVGYLISHLISR